MYFDIVFLVLALIFACYAMRDKLAEKCAGAKELLMPFLPIDYILPLEQFNGLENNHSEITLYYTEWCGYCKLMKPVYFKLKKNLANHGITFKEVDCDKVSVPFVTGYPTIIKTGTDGKRVKYEGGADYNDLMRFVIGKNI